MGFKSAMNTIVRKLEPSLSRKNSLSRLNGTPGRGEIVRGSYYSHGVEKKVRKSRRKEAERQLVRRRDITASDSEVGSPDKKNTRDSGKTALAGPGRVASLFGFIENHPNLPHILSFYAQLLLNVFIVFFIMFVIYSFWSTIRSDVDKKSEEAITEIMADMAKCAKDYQENGCDKDTRAPALELLCNQWELCMKKDPRSLGRAKVSAHTFAEIFNSFIEPISYKAMVCCPPRIAQVLHNWLLTRTQAFSLVLIFGCFAASNFAFGFFRNRMHTDPPPMPYAQTPRHPSVPQDFYWNQYQASVGREPAASLGAFESGMPSPTRRLQY